MILRGLKTNIALQLTALLVVAMFSIDFIVTTSVQRLLVDAAVSRCQNAVSTVHTLLKAHPRYTELSPGDFNPAVIEAIADDSKISCLVTVNAQHTPLVSTGDFCPPLQPLTQAIAKAMETGKSVIEFSGTTWGVFWKQHRLLMLAAPLIVDKTVVAGTGVVLALDSLYQRLRKIHSILLIYIMVNTGLLVLVGVWGLSKVTLKPLRRLVKRADEFSVHEDTFFLHDAEANEFSRLSSSLNQMLKRISDDKQTLQETIRSLEETNLELNKAQVDIVRAEKFAAVGRLASGLAHEIGNPIGIVMGYFELLKQADLPEDEKQEYIRRAESEINRIHTLVRQLLACSRQSECNIGPLSVHAMLGETAEVFRIQPLTAGIPIRLDLAASQDTVLANAEQLRQVFLNLIINAVDAVNALDQGRAGELTIATETLRVSGRPPKRKNLLKITIADNGIGIPAHCVDKIFDPFYTTKAPGKGTGLGLSVSYRIVADLGGTIEVESRIREGTAIIIHLPVYTGTQRVHDECTPNNGGQ